jgi:hypothetical protein
LAERDSAELVGHGRQRLLDVQSPPLVLRRGREHKRRDQV